MYTVDEKDKVVELEAVPQSDAGAPLPFVIASEMAVVLAYYIPTTPIWLLPREQRDAAVSRYVPLALVQFKFCRAHMFGPPNDEAFHGHPLASRGLGPYGAYRIEHSSWIRQLERMNSVHSLHRPETYLELQHLVFSFHDSTFECVCKGFEARVIEADGQTIVQEALRIFRQS